MIEQFIADPWSKSHPAYGNSAFGIKPAPEFSTAEVAVASLYRAVGFADHAESDVPKAGKEFSKKAHEALTRPTTSGRVKADTWRTVLSGVLESPKQPKQSSQRFLQLCPLVPDAALYSGSARLKGNSWNPGALIKRMVVMGSPNIDAANKLWARLFQALSVNDQDDIWARWLQDELVIRRRADVSWEETDLHDISDALLVDADKQDIRYPAKQFVHDLASILEAKDAMTRRQWISLLEAVIRLGITVHVIWLAQVNSRLWKAVSAAMLEGEPRLWTIAEIKDELLAVDSRCLTYGNAAITSVKDYASGYLSARIGLNLTLWALEQSGVAIESLNSTSDVKVLIESVSKHRAAFEALEIRKRFSEIQDSEAKTIFCKKGVGSNILEFCRYTLGQRQTTNDSLRGYDQSYFLKKRSDARNSPWVLSLGPVAVLAIVHCCLRNVSGPRSIKRLADHLSWYGIEADVDSINESDLGKSLRMLGLVLDSPDAESGMLLVPPFGQLIQESKN